MNILVTGCAGFIASKVGELLLKTNNTLIGMDNLNDSYDVRLKKWRLQQLTQYRNFKFFKSDIINLNEIKPLFKSHNFDAIINLAARAGVRYSVKNPRIYLDTNIIGTLNLLELCRKYNIKKYVLASTSSIYGETDLPFIEDKKTDYPLSPYAASKKGAEALCYTYHYLYGIDISIPRYFTVYGPAGRPDMSYFIFIKKIKAGEEITVYGDGNQERDFTYIDDIAAGTVAALKPMKYQIINLGNNHPVKLNYIISLIESSLHKKAKIRYLPRHPADVSATWADINKAKELLSWSPKINIENGIQKTVNWFEENWEWAKEINI
jgi:nucleoside-diphosphate-sugar epimerase